ncbi:MAG: DUF4982 domain-containing protein [Lachnospiraceae bacterium]|nr:DUF4982 domain-containing protein [Lachnospiraceae bacterium]
MIAEKWNEGWKFWEDRDSFALVWGVPEEAREIRLPHDAMIERPARADSPNGGNTGFRDGGTYTYVKCLYAPEEAREETWTLRFEGVYRQARVYVNEQYAGGESGGYVPFYVPLNDFLRYGEENEIRVQVRNGGVTNSRWYSGSGIYRDVYLLRGPLSHIAPDGVRADCEEAGPDLAVVRVRTELKNRRTVPAELILRTELRDADGAAAGAEESRVVLFGGETRTLTQRIAVENPQLWSDEHPALYRCESTLSEDGQTVDSQTETVGLRTLRLDAKRGLRVNGESVKLRGACIHHDSGLLGAATYEEVHLRQMRLLKEAGFNAIRMSHHPAAPALLRACDQVGIYVMDELTDMWDRSKSEMDFSLYFEQCWEETAEAMVRNAYNHPSVILYSLGNEIPEIGTAHGAETCHRLAEKVRSLDGTRYTLASINGVFAAGDQVDRIVSDISASLQATGEISGNVNDFMTLMDGHMDEIVVHEAISERLERACANVDIAGYNYMTARYEPDGVQYPNRVIVGSETYPPEIARNWALVKRLPHVIGDFTWTGWDYIGEAGVGIPAYRFGEGGFGAGFPCQLAYCGDLDITGWRRPVSYFRECVFGLRTEPYLAVQDPRRYGQTLIKTPWVLSDTVSSWTWRGCEGQPVIVEVYAPGDEVELIVNGVSAGRQPSGEAAGYRALFETVYTPGSLCAVCYRDGTETGRTALASAEGAAQLCLTQEEPAGTELIFLTAELRDAQGVLITDADRELTVSVEGGCSLAGFGSGDPKPRHNYNEGVTETWNGRAQLILKKGAGRTRVQVASADGLTALLEREA